MKENQRKLYNHYMKNSIEGANEAIRGNAKVYAANILKSYPEFEVKVKGKK